MPRFGVCAGNFVTSSPKEGVKGCILRTTPKETNIGVDFRRRRSYGEPRSEASFIGLGFCRIR